MDEPCKSDISSSSCVVGSGEQVVRVVKVKVAELERGQQGLEREWKTLQVLLKVLLWEWQWGCQKGLCLLTRLGLWGFVGCLSGLGLLNTPIRDQQLVWRRALGFGT